APEPLHHQYVERVVDLLDPAANRITNMSVDEARDRVGSSEPERVREIAGSFALVVREGKRVRLAFPGSAHALFPRQTGRRPGVARGGTGRCPPCLVEAGKAREPISSQLHANGPG